MKRIFLIIFIICSYGYASTAAAFLDNGIAARSESMGRAFSAVADDLDAFYYNPAGYAFQDKVRLNSMTTKMDNVTNVYYAGVGYPLFKGYSAINFYTARLDSIPETQYVNGRIVDTGNSFDYASKAFFLSYATGLNDFLQVFKANNEDLKNMSIGFNLKYINESLYRKNATGMGLDAGFMYKMDDVTWGYSVLNLLEPVMTWDTESKEKNTVERVQKIGLAWQVQKDIKLSGDLTMRKNDSLSGVGAEYVLFNLVALRAGLMTNKYAVGLGLNNYEGFNFDYVYLISADSLIENTHKFSLGYVFGGAKQSAVTTKSSQPIAAVLTMEASATPAVKETAKELPKVTPNSSTTISAQVTLLKKNFVVADNKLKCYYKINNSGTTARAITVTVMIVSAADKVLDKRTKDDILTPGQETLLEESLYVGGAAAGQYKIKSYLKINTETSDYLDDIELK